MDSDINPTLLLGIIGGILLFGATTMINGTIWATSIDVTTPAHIIDSTGSGMMSKSDERNALSQAGDIARWATGRRGNAPRGVAADCLQPALGPGDEWLDVVCEHDL